MRLKRYIKKGRRVSINTKYQKHSQHNIIELSTCTMFLTAIDIKFLFHKVKKKNKNVFACAEIRTNRVEYVCIKCESRNPTTTVTDFD